MKPPHLADRLLALFCAPHLLEAVQGDLHEEFAFQVERLGERKARWWYWREVLGFLKPFALKRRRNEFNQPVFLHPVMLRNYFKIAWRGLLKSKLYASINVFGLALGMACSLLIGLWVKDELSFNRFLPGADAVYFVRVNSEQNGEIQTSENTPGPLAAAIRKDVPEVIAATKVAHWPRLLMKVGEKTGKENGYFATEEFFEVFRLPVLAGNPGLTLADPTQIVITRNLAETYFPGGQALGQRLQLDNARYYTVGAVLETIPITSTIRPDWIANFKAFEQDWMKQWENSTFRTYVRLAPNATPGQAEAVMRSIYPRYTRPDRPTAPVLQPITDFYLYRNYKQGRPAGGRIGYVRVFSLVAGFILLIACINFMNLATARSSLRAREVGVRKVVGAGRASLVGQFLSEALLLSLLAAGLALLLLWLSLPAFNAVFARQLTIDPTDPMLWGGFAVLILVTGCLSGSYPALFLSSLPPIRILKGTLRMGVNATLFRQGLVVFQFSMAIFLIVGMLAVARQMAYVQRKNLGLDRENVVCLPLEGELLFNHKDAFRRALLRLPTVVSAAATGELPVNILAKTTSAQWPGKDPTHNPELSATWVGPDFVRTMGITLRAGRDFQVDHAADSSSYLINEAAAKLMGLKNPIGQEITFWHGKGPIIGLIKNFHLQSLHQPIGPLILAFDDRNTSYLLVKIRAGQTTEALTDMERLAKQFNPNYPFTYQFLDEAYGKLYRSEQQVSLLVRYFGALAIMISCLGLFGLATFAAEQRTKEIGVRKTLGASVAGIVGLLTKDFLKPVFVALLVACPAAWWALGKWLGTFEYRTQVSWWMLAAAGAVAVGIALLTVSFQSIKAALMNPVKSLRSE